MGMQSHVIMPPSLQVAKRRTQRKTWSGLVLWVSHVPAGCTFRVLSAALGVVIIYCPINGVLGSWTLFLETVVQPERGLLRFATQGYLNRRDAKEEGLIADQRSTIHQNLSNDGLELF